MFCKHCGKELLDDAAFCPHCGAALKESPEKDEFFDAPPARPSYTPPAEKKAQWNPLSIVGFVLSFVVAIAGLICSIIALKQCRETGQDSKGMALAGIIISAVSRGITTLYLIILFASGAFYEIFYDLLAVL